ncbi:hypothetical protein LUX73_20315 [Actinomadura madurae]|nr:hypothetical protein [Actinomadura madurae]MCQ0006771.1 hypothetical protein [Actinomadura madurae]
MTSTPPSTWPATAPPDSATASIPCARARAVPVKWIWMPDSTCGTISAPAAPWASRAATSAPVDGESPHPSDASVNAPSPSRNIRRCPRTSPQPGAGDEQDGVRERVAGNDQFEGAAGRPEVAVDGGRGDVHDRDVDVDHELAGQQHREHQGGPPGPGRRGHGR